MIYNKMIGLILVLLAIALVLQLNTSFNDNEKHFSEIILEPANMIDTGSGYIENVF